MGLFTQFIILMDERIKSLYTILNQTLLIDNKKIY